MELKKTPQADLTRKFPLFFTIGLCISMLLVFSAFEWTFSGKMHSMDFKTLEEEPFDVILEETVVIDMPPPTPIQTIAPQPEIVESEEETKVEEIEKLIKPVVTTNTTSVVSTNIPTGIPEPTEIEEPVSDEPLIVSEIQPAFPGGLKAFYKYIGKKLKYPKIARRTHTEGKVIVQFVVDRDGSLTNIQVLKGIGAGCDEEAVRVLQHCPKWNPGKQRGKPVKVRMSFPIVFDLK